MKGLKIVTYRIPTNVPTNKNSNCGWVAMLNDKEIGWVTMSFLANKEILFENAYVDEKYRRKGVYTKLWEARWEFVNKHYKGYTIRTYCRDTTIDVFEKKGFQFINPIYLMEYKIQ